MSVFLENSNLGCEVHFVLQCLNAALKKPEENSEAILNPLRFLLKHKLSKCSGQSSHLHGKKCAGCKSQEDAFNDYLEKKKYQI